MATPTERSAVFGFGGRPDARRGVIAVPLQTDFSQGPIKLGRDASDKETAA